MNKLRIELFVSLFVHAGYTVLGVFSIVLGILSNDLTQIIQGCAFFALGTAYLILGIERILNSKLDIIHGWFGPYEKNVIDKKGFIFTSMGFLANLCASILIYLSLTGHLPIDYSNLAIGLIGLGMGLSSLGKTYIDNNKYDDIAKGFHEMAQGVHEIKDDITKIEDRLNEAKEGSTSSTNSMPDV